MLLASCSDIWLRVYVVYDSLAANPGRRLQSRHPGTSGGMLHSQRHSRWCIRLILRTVLEIVLESGHAPPVASRLAIDTCAPRSRQISDALDLYPWNNLAARN